MRQPLVLLPFLVALIAVPGRAADEPAKSVVFTSEAGKFSVTLPAKPKKQTTRTPTALGELDVHLYVVDLKDRAYVTAYCDYPAGTVTDANRQQMLDGVRDGNVKSGNGKLVSEKKITLGKDKLDGRETLIERKDLKGFYRARIFLKGDRLYQVAAVGTGNWVKTDPITDYLDSFEIDD